MRRGIVPSSILFGGGSEGCDLSNRKTVRNATKLAGRKSNGLSVNAGGACANGALVRNNIIAPSDLTGDIAAMNTFNPCAARRKGVRVHGKTALEDTSTLAGKAPVAVKRNKTALSAPSSFIVRKTFINKGILAGANGTTLDVVTKGRIGYMMLGTNAVQTARSGIGFNSALIFTKGDACTSYGGVCSCDNGSGGFGIGRKIATCVCLSSHYSCRKHLCNGNAIGISVPCIHYCLCNS